MVDDHEKILHAVGQRAKSEMHGPSWPEAALVDKRVSCVPWGALASLLGGWPLEVSGTG